VLFNQQEFAVLFNDCRHGGAGFPSDIHARIIGKERRGPPLAPSPKV